MVLKQWLTVKHSTLPGIRFSNQLLWLDLKSHSVYQTFKGIAMAYLARMTLQGHNPQQWPPNNMLQCFDATVFWSSFFQSQYIVNTLRHSVTSIIGFLHDRQPVADAASGCNDFMGTNSLHRGHSLVSKGTDHQKLDISIIFGLWGRDNYLHPGCFYHSMLAWSLHVLYASGSNSKRNVRFE